MSATMLMACPNCHLHVKLLERGQPCGGCGERLNKANGNEPKLCPAKDVWFSVQAAKEFREGVPPEKIKDPGRKQRKPRRTGNSRRRNPGFKKDGGRVTSARGPEPAPGFLKDEEYHPWGSLLK